GSVGGRITVRTGNGDNSLALHGAQAYLVDVQFGNGNHTFTLNNAAATVSGRADGGGQTAADVFNLVAGTVPPPFPLLHFPWPRPRDAPTPPAARPPGGGFHFRAPRTPRTPGSDPLP